MMQKVMKVIIIILGVFIVLFYAYLFGLWYIIRNVSFAP